jgi:putative ATP-binding cassette transporter
LTSFEASFTARSHAQRPLAAIDSEALDVSGLSLALPDGSLLLASTALHAAAGARVLLQGPSGSGKSTLFRTLAGIWPFATGSLARPVDAMFIPQRPYFPNGPLRDALAYPSLASQYNDAQLHQALQDAELPALADRLDEAGAWSQQLSGGEQQRLAIARVLLKKPRWVFADEATSALDEATEKKVYEQLLSLVRAGDGALFSIAHRPAVAGFHGTRWVLQPQTAGDLARYKLVEQAA